MTLRATVALTWALVVGLAGGWLILAPWAVGQQPASGDWTSVTNAQVRTGAGLLVLSVVGLVLAIVEGVSVLRKAGVLARRIPASQAGQGQIAPGEAEAQSGDLDRALISLANTLAADLDSSRRPAGGDPGVGASGRPEVRRD